MTTYECSKCKYSSYKKEHVIRHINVRNNKCWLDETPTIVKKDGFIACKFCKKLCSSRSALIYHTKSSCEIKKAEDIKKLDAKNNLESKKLVESKETTTSTTKQTNGHQSNFLFCVVFFLVFLFQEYILLYNENIVLKSKLETRQETRQKTNQKSKKPKRKTPLILRQRLWVSKFIDSIYGNCEVCNEVISVFDFHASHIVSKHNGGSDFIENLACACANCNLSMGTTNLRDFKKKYFSQQGGPDSRRALIQKIDA
jgi:5-methylcytosine-specific restriction endonuclease McrA